MKSLKDTQAGRVATRRNPSGGEPGAGVRGPGRKHLRQRRRSSASAGRKRGGQRGSAVVEGALVLTVFLVTFIGIIDIGTLLFRMQSLTERARAGARWGVVNTYNPTGIRNVVIYGNAAGTGNPLFGLTADMVSVNQVDLGDGVAKIQVRINNYPFKFFTPFIAGNRSLNRIEVSLTTESLGAT